MHGRIVLVAALVALVACGDDPSDQSEADVDTEVVTCTVEGSRPVAEVEVTNTTDEPGAFAVVVEFSDAGTVLGTGQEVTGELAAGDSQVIRMANMQRDASSVTDCTVESVDRL